MGSFLHGQQYLGELWHVCEFFFKKKNFDVVSQTQNYSKNYEIKIKNETIF